ARIKGIGRMPGREMLVVTGLVALLIAGGCSHLMMMMGTGIEPPPASEFGLGPRRSVQGLYEATLEPAQELRVRRMQQVTLTVRGPDGKPVTKAKVAVDGGMPQHGHGLPTQP